jgi:hypothetical protein
MKSITRREQNEVLRVARVADEHKVLLCTIASAPSASGVADSTRPAGGHDDGAVLYYEQAQRYRSFSSACAQLHRANVTALVKGGGL